jgi:hypothetical protein
MVEGGRKKVPEDTSERQTLVDHGEDSRFYSE